MNLEELWLGKNKITSLEVRSPSPSDGAVSEPVCILESREFETPTVIIDAIKPSDEARELGRARKPRGDLPQP